MTIVSGSILMALLSVTSSTALAQDPNAASFVSDPVVAAPAAPLSTDDLSGSEALTDLNLEELLNIKTTIATKRELTRRESPGIISIVTREEIANSGARDLREILQIFVPGTTFGVDVEGAVGIGLRGIWGHEGKILLMMDQVPLNDDVYSNTFFGNHYPAELIDRVEVIRGPGSVIHGGYALLGAVNIVTRAPKNKVIVAFRDSEMSKSLSHRNTSFATSVHGKDWKTSVALTIGQGNRSQEQFVDGKFNAADLTNNSRLDPKLVNVGVSYKGLEVRGIIDHYATKHFHLEPTIPADGAPIAESFESRNLQASYRYSLSENLVLIPKYRYRETHPYNFIAPAIPPAEDTVFLKFSKSHLFGLHADWKFDETKSVLAGIEHSNLKVDLGDPALDAAFAFHPNGLREDFFTTFAELSWATSYGNVVLGGRYQKPINYDSAFVPRLSFTRAFDQWHYKGMVSRSYRVPAGIHADLTAGPEVKPQPEFATNLEFETGYKFSDKLFAVVNAYDTRIDDPIVFIAEPLPDGSYANDGKLGTQGVELEVRSAVRPFEVTANVAYYRRAHATDERYVVPGQDDAYIGMPNLRANMMLGYHFNQKFGVFPSAVYFGDTYGFVPAGADINGDPTTVLTKFSPQIILNFNARYRDLFVEGLNVSAGVMNLNDQNRQFLQAYQGGFPPIPDLARAYNFAVSYRYGF